jgi:hypothetical protein
MENMVQRRIYGVDFSGAKDAGKKIWIAGGVILACVLPMQGVQPDKPWILEICPASTLKRESLYLQGYKQGDEGYAARARILEGIEATGILSISSSTVRSTILDEPHGDALDSVIAAFATFRALRNLSLLSVDSNNAYALEGYVYV